MYVLKEKHVLFKFSSKHKSIFQMTINSMSNTSIGHANISKTIMSVK